MLNELDRQIDKLAHALEDSGLREYNKYLRDRKRLIWTNLLSGMMRGLGSAIGFTILGAIVIYVLQYIATENIPIIGEFIASIVRIVKANS